MTTCPTVEKAEDASDIEGSKGPRVPPRSAQVAPSSTCLLHKHADSQACD